MAATFLPVYPNGRGSGLKIRTVQVRIQPRAPFMIKVHKDKGKHYQKYYYDIDFSGLLKIYRFFSHMLASSIDLLDNILDNLTLHNLYVIFIKPTM